MADQQLQPRGDQVPQSIDELLASEPFKSLNRDQRKALKQNLGLVQVSASVSQSYSGPLPPPELLGRFNQVIPNGAERLMIMVEQQHNHRIAIETTVVKNQQWQSTIGQYFALLITMAGLILSGWLIYRDHDVAGSAIGVATIGSVAIAFITGQHKQASDLKTKKQAMGE